jgi:DNA-binding response OmpR family regulator
MIKARILWIEGKRGESPPFVSGLRKKGIIVETVSSGDEAISRLLDFDPDLVVINAASMRTSGKRTSLALRTKAHGTPILQILAADQKVPSDPNVDVVLSLPFTQRKLLNRIGPLIPGDSENLLHVGPVRLDMERKRVRCLGREATLTPRLAQLLKQFLEHPGEVIERGLLFREIWNTEYTGDTRTLDVHISWLRQAIEENPHEPRFLKTIRGLGYRFDL